MIADSKVGEQENKVKYTIKSIQTSDCRHSQWFSNLKKFECIPQSSHRHIMILHCGFSLFQSFDHLFGI